MNRLFLTYIMILCTIFLLFAILSCDYKNNSQQNRIADSSLLVNQVEVFDSNYTDIYLEKIIEKLYTLNFFVLKRSRNVSKSKMQIHNNFVNSGIRFSNVNDITDKPIKQLELAGLDQLEIIKFKKENRIEGNIYPKLILEVWIFNNSENRDNAKKELDQLSEREWFFIQKNKILYWCFLDNNIMFLSAGASYYDHKLEEISELIKETYQ